MVLALAVCGCGGGATSASTAAAGGSSVPSAGAGGGATSASTDAAGGSSVPSAGGDGSSAAPSIDGLWSASSDNLGSTLALTLSSKGSGEMVVSGTGTYSVGAIRTGSVVVTGTYRPPSAALIITYDHGETVTFTTAVVDSNQMKGKLAYKSGTVIDVEFVRP